MSTVSRTRRTGRLTLAGMTLIGLIGLTFALAQQPAGAQPTPEQVTFACAGNLLGVVRYAETPDDCSWTETLVVFDPADPTWLCIRANGTLVRHVDEAGDCLLPDSAVQAPNDNQRLYFCVNQFTNRFRTAAGPGTCWPTFFPVYIEQGNQPPVADDIAVQTPEDTPVGITLTATDPNNNPLTFTVTSTPAHGDLSGTEPNLTYTPDSNFSGVDSFTFEVSDGLGGVDAGTVTITVTSANDQPVHGNPDFDVQSNMQVVVAAPGLLEGANDDADGQPASSLTVSNLSATNPAGGTFSAVGADGSFTFDPPAGYSGVVTATYDVCDADAACASGTVTFTVSGAVIWFVDPAAGSDGSGTLASPFNTLASADAVNSASTPIFVLSGSTGGIALEAGETLIGQGVTGSDFDTLFGITPPAGTIARPAINGTAPVLAGAVSLAGDTTLRGVAIAPASGTIGLSAQSATGIVVGEVSVTTSAATAVSLLDVDGTFDFSSVSADGATNGIMLSNVGPTGSVTISGGTIQNSTDDGIVASDVEDLSLAGMTVSNSGGDGIVVEAVAGGTSSVDVTNSSISDSVLTGVQLFTFDTSNAQVAVTGTAFHSNNIGVDLVAFGGQSTFTIDGNTFTEQGHNAINIFTDATTTAATTMIGTISNNVIGGAGAGSGSVLGTGIGFDLRGGADGIVLMENNSISNTTLQGIIAETRLGDGELDLTLIGNTIGAPEDPFGAVDGIRVTSRNARTTCLDATGNTSAGINGGAGISLRQANSAVFALDGYLGAAGDTTAIAAYLASQNTATVSVQTSGSGTIVNYTNETCSTP